MTKPVSVSSLALPGKWVSKSSIKGPPGNQADFMDWGVAAAAMVSEPSPKRTLAKMPLCRLLLFREVVPLLQRDRAHCRFPDEISRIISPCSSIQDRQSLPPKSVLQ